MLLVKRVNIIMFSSKKNRHVCHAWFDEDVIDQEVEKHIISLLIEK